MAKRPVSAQELAAVASRFNGTPVDNNPRAFKFPDAAASDAWNKSVDRLEAGETLDAVLGNKPSRSTTGAAPLDAAVGFVGGLAHQILDPAIQASRALLPSGMGVEAAAERLGGGRQALTESDLYKKATYVPETKAGTLGAYAPVIAGTATGIATEGAVPTALTLGGALLGQKSAEAGAGYIASQPAFALTPEQIEAWRGLAGTAGMVAGGAGAHRVAPRVTVPEAIQAIKNAPSAVSESAKQRAAGATLGGIKGYKLGGYPAGVVGSVAGAISPETAANASKASIVNALERVASGAKELTPAPKPSIFDENVAAIGKADEIVSQKPTVDTTTPVQKERILKTLQEGIEAHKANKTTPSDELVRLHNAFAAEKETRNAAIAQEKAGRELEGMQSNISDMREMLTMLNGRFELLEPDMSLARKYYNELGRTIAKYDAAGQQPPAEFVEAFDHVHDIVLKDKTIDAAAYDNAIQALTEAATQSPKAFDAVVESLPSKVMSLVQSVGRDVFNELRSASRNAGGRLVQGEQRLPWIVRAARRAMDLDRKPLAVSGLGAMDVPTAMQAAGGDATIPSGVDVVRVSPQAAVSQPAMPPELAAAESVEVAPTQSNVAQAKGRRTPQQRAEERGGSTLKLDASKLSEERAREITNKQTFFRNALELRQLLGEFYALPSSSGERGIWLYTRKPNGLTNAESLSRFQNDIFKVSKQVTKPEDVVKFVQLEGAMNDPSFRPYLRNLFKSLKKKS